MALGLFITYPTNLSVYIGILDDKHGHTLPVD